MDRYQWLDWCANQHHNHRCQSGRSIVTSPGHQLASFAAAAFRLQLLAGHINNPVALYTVTFIFFAFVTFISWAEHGLGDKDRDHGQ